MAVMRVPGLPMAGRLPVEERYGRPGILGRLVSGPRLGSPKGHRGNAGSSKAGGRTGGFGRFTALEQR